MERFAGPSYDEMMPFVIQALKDLGGSGSIYEIDQRAIVLMRLSESITEYPHKTGTSTEVEYRLAWSRTYLKKAGLVENSGRGIWSLTQSGRESAKVDPPAIVEEVRRLASLTQSRQQKNVSLNDDNLENDGIDLPDEIQSWREKLRNILYNLAPDAFERLAQRILRESGFTQVEVTGRTGDGGIDGTGTIKLNGIISFHMLFQCKRYQGSVSSSEMRDFRGAMQGRADKGLFITTGKFTSGAVNEANRAGTTPIDLVDGDELIEKLKDLRLGVKPIADYTIDEAWFHSI